jgi:hypothetical protein
MSLPVFTISYRTHPNIADNIFDAQMDGAPKVLTYDGTNPLLRKAAMRFNDGRYSGKVPILKPSPAFLSGAKTDRDEYPFACTLDGGAASRIAHVPESENRSAGALMLAFFKKNQMAIGSHFRVRITDHIRGEITEQCRVKCRGCVSLCR